jgi:hypothetical protein
MIWSSMLPVHEQTVSRAVARSLPDFPWIDANASERVRNEAYKNQ